MWGDGEGHEADIALMPLEGSSINAKALSNALSVIVIAEKRQPVAYSAGLYGKNRHWPWI